MHAHQEQSLGSLNYLTVHEYALLYKHADIVLPPRARTVAQLSYIDMNPICIII